MDLLCMVGIRFCFVFAVVQSLCVVRYYGDYRIILHRLQNSPYFCVFK